MKKYIVKDWAGNLMEFGPFACPQDAWDFLLDRFENEEDLQEYFVEEEEAA